MTVYDAKTNNKTDVDAVKDEDANSDATIVANGTFFTKQSGSFGKWTVGTVITGGGEIKAISKRVMEWKEEKRRLPQYRAFFGKASDGSIVNGRSDKNGGNEAVDQSPLPNAALSGLIAFLPKAKEETYTTVLSKMNDVHRSQYRNAMSHIGYAKDDDIFFLLFSPGNDDVWPKFYDSDLDRGVSGGLFEKLVKSGGPSVVCYGLDGGSSVGVAHRDLNGSWTTPSKGLKHRSPVGIPPYGRVNNYIIVNVGN